MTSSTYPTWASGDEITAALLDGMQWHFIVKSTNEDVVDSGTLQDDDELLVPLEANATYYVVAHHAMGGDNPGGTHWGHINTEWTAPSGATGWKFSMGPTYPGDATSDRENTNMVSAVHSFATDRRYGTVSLTSAAAAIEHLWVTTSNTSGNLQFRFANGSNTTGVNTSRMLAGSFITYVRVA